FSSRRRHTRWPRDWSSDVCSSDLEAVLELAEDGLVGDDLLRLHLAEEVPDLPHALGGVLDVGLGVAYVGLEDLADVLDELLAVRSEERRVGKEWRCWWGCDHEG